MNQPHKIKIFHKLFFIGIFLAVIYFTPWSKINWGKFEVLPGSSITVTGQSKQDVKNQIARFSAGVTISHDDKRTAIDQVNTKMTAVIKAVKDFGIEDKDIQTQSVSVNQINPPDREILSYPPRPRNEEKQWRASNSISLVLRDIDKASELTDLLHQLEATNVHGPNFSLDDTQSLEADLLASAVEDARSKADKLAKASGRKLGKVLTINESGTSFPTPVFRMAAETVDSAPVEPGSGRISKTVTVTFELE